MSDPAPLPGVDGPGAAAVRYRTATVDDAPRLAELRWDFRLEETPGATVHGRAEFMAACTAFFADGLSQGNWTVWVAEFEGTLVACICLFTIVKIPKPNRLRDTFGYVTNVYTRPAYRNQGIGSGLMARVIEWAREQDLNELYVSPSDRSVPFYERAGFVAPSDMWQLVLRPYVP